MQKSIMKKTYFISALLLLVVSCDDSSRHDLIDHFSVPAEAYDVKKLKLGSKTQQLFFRVRSTYPSLRVVKQYEEYLHKEGWAKCGGTPATWDSFRDESSSDPVRVHRVLEYWINKDKHLLLLLSAIYYSKVNAVRQPDNDEQNLIIWVQKPDDLQSEVSRLSINCTR